MSREFRTIALTGKRRDTQAAESLRILATHLRGVGVRVVADTRLDIDFDDPAIERGALDDMAAAADLMVAVGGDGTMLYATRRVAAHGVPVLGINRGRLGFLADVSPDGMLNCIDEVLAGSYAEERRLMLDARIGDGGEHRRAVALNDVVLQKRATGRMLDFRNRIDGVYVNTHGGDGLIVATPTGSTAYALSGGGPILHPGIHAIAVVPICPHTLSDRPVVVSADSTVEVSLPEAADARADVVCDGQMLGELTPGETLTIRRAEVDAILIHPRDHDFYRILRSKLHWGRGGRTRPDSFEEDA